MPKPIKFNLILDGKPVRDLDGLKENFNMDDLLDHYKSGLLMRWLKVRDFDKLAGKISAIQAEDDMEIAKSLVSCFEMALNEQEIRAAVYPIVFRKEKQEKLKRFEENGFKEKDVVAKYHENYVHLLNQLKVKKGDYAFIKTALNRIYEDFLGLFRLGFEKYFHDIEKEAPLIPIAVLANENLRGMLFSYPEIKRIIKNFLSVNLFKNIPTAERKKDIDIQDISNEQVNDEIVILAERFRKGEVNIDVFYFSNHGKQNNILDIKGSDVIAVLDANPYVVDGTEIVGKKFHKKHPIIEKIENCSPIDLYYTTIEKIKESIVSTQNQPTRGKKIHPKNQNNTPKTVLQINDVTPYLKTFSGKTESYWKDIESKGKKYLILRMEAGNFVRNAGKSGEEISAETANDTFPILDGIDYKSNNAKHMLVYMEI